MLSRLRRCLPAASVRLQAPVIDSCGSAGGRLPGQGNGGFGAGYVNTTHSKVGDLGSKTLPVHDTKTVWKTGVEYEVAWTIQAVSHHLHPPIHAPTRLELAAQPPSSWLSQCRVARRDVCSSLPAVCCLVCPQNHGGGYSYRLCPLGSEKLDEDCFNKVGLKMVGQSKLRWGGVGGRELPFDAVTVTEGTKAGVMWRKNPVPRAWHDKTGKWGKGSNQHQTGEGFQPVCDDEGMDQTGYKQSCTGEWGPYNMVLFRGPRSPACSNENIADSPFSSPSRLRCFLLRAPQEIVDKVLIPEGLQPGKWVLNWRMDQEESNQIWQSCSDITITL